jgi:hypothetical protein
MMDYEHSQIARFVDSNSLLVMTKERIVRLFCPFVVEVILETKGLHIGEQLSVSKVLLSEKHKLVYLIKGKPYYFALFQIHI